MPARPYGRRTTPSHPSLATPSRACLLERVDDREPRTSFEAVGGEQRSADVAREERVPRLPPPADLLERVDGEPSRPLQPPLVAGALEDLQERVAVPGSAVAE